MSINMIIFDVGLQLCYIIGIKFTLCTPEIINGISVLYFVMEIQNVSPKSLKITMFTALSIG